MHPRLSTNVYIEEVGEKNSEKIYLVLDPEIPSWVFLNEDALEILKLCDGNNSIEKISRIISEKQDKIEFQDSLGIVSSFLDSMKKNRILYGHSYKKLNNNQFHGLALEITKKCNLRCTHCYLTAGDANNNELTLQEIKELLKSTKDSKGVSIALGGGEPLLRDDCFNIIEYAASLDLLISLGTNGTLIDKKLAKLLSEFPIKVQISLDGASKETHDEIRGIGSFELTIRGIDNLINEGMAKDIVIAFTPMKSNVNEIPEIINFALERQISVVQFPPLTSSGRAKKRWHELKLSNDEMFRSWEFILTRSKELKGKMNLLSDCFSINIDNIGVPYRCSIGTQFRVDPEGNVYPCQCFHYGAEYCLGNVRKNSLQNMVYGYKIKELKKICFQRPLNIEKCRQCKWVNFCGSGCMGNSFESNGTILKPDSCEVRRKWIEKLFEVKLKEIQN